MLRRSFAFLCLCLAMPAASLAGIPWPVDGAPVCTAPGDQSRIFPLRGTCGGVALMYLDESLSTPTWRFGAIDASPPTGACSEISPVFEAPGGHEPSSGLLRIPGLGGPYCNGPIHTLTWVQTHPDGQAIVAWIPIFSLTPRVVVDSGAVTFHEPQVTGSGYFSSDTALVAVWSDDRSGVPQIRAQLITSDGQPHWGPHGMAIAPTTSAQTSPRLLRDDFGYRVVWIDARSGGADVYGTYLLNDGTIAPGWPATGRAFESRPEIAANPMLVAAAFGGTMLLWEETGARFGGHTQIVALSFPGPEPDPAWDPAGVPVSSSATVEHLQCASFDGGTLATVWTDIRAASPANPTDLYINRLTINGTIAPGWPASGLALCTAPGRQDHAALDPHAASTTFVAWEDSRNGSVDIYAQLLQPNGAVATGRWQPGGIPATSAAGDQRTPVVGIARNGMIVGWVDGRGDAAQGLDIYAQSFLSDGELADVPPGTRSGTLWLAAPRPNPARGRSVFSLRLPRAEHVRLELLDAAGRSVRTLADRDLAAGDATIESSLDALAPGYYRVRLRAGAHTESRTLLVMR